MGSCSSHLRPNALVTLQLGIYTYPRDCTICIKASETGQENESIDFRLTDPINLRYDTLLIFNSKIIISECVLPGVDPRDTYLKKCQDSALVLIGKECILTGVFDGHGSHGDLIADYCASYAKTFFKTNWNDSSVIFKQPDPIGFLRELCMNCDSALIDYDAKIDCTNSGSTAVFVLLHNAIAYTASIGNSRAMLASIVKHEKIIDSTLQDDLIKLKKMHHRRKSSLSKTLHTLQLTKDQIPEDPEEYNRLTESGAKVRRIIDDKGNKIGPYRVWKRGCNYPGLAMSRSIGDTIAKEIGIISDPIITDYSLNFSQDLFIVLATDGIWNSMDNEDVSNFVEVCRMYSAKTANKENTREVNVRTACIAQLLCEEARFRWLSIVEEDNVPIDDISCIVIELPKLTINKQVSLKRKATNRAKAIETVKIPGDENLPGVYVKASKDPKRSSMCSEDFVAQKK
ncbi:hypothetical protein SteCoe_36634 [Stentor coeruleus]|uniref:PPM-type phosphatase domain-containing protein n=1 Tax=Stentor coeruleus TaxID=5963 RepID=A0A1R2APR2_9CILI|nr:hypothetical protein SteCoe_36634 [Stentor coeruleus]